MNLILIIIILSACQTASGFATSLFRRRNRRFLVDDDCESNNYKGATDKIDVLDFPTSTFYKIDFGTANVVETVGSTA